MNSIQLPRLSRNPWNLSHSRYLFILGSFAQGVVVIALEAVIYTLLKENGGVSNAQARVRDGNATPSETSAADALKSILVYLVLFMFSQVFQVVLSIESVYLKNTLQIFGILIFNLMTFIYSIFQLYQFSNLLSYTPESGEELKRSITVYVILVSSIIGVCEVVISYLGFKLYREFGWSIYRIIGSDLSMRKMLLRYHFFLMVLKFDVFFFLGFVIQFLVLVVDIGQELYLTIAAVPIIIAILWLGMLGVRKENKYLLGLNLVGFVLGTIYFSYKIGRIWSFSKYTNFRYFMTLFATLSLIFLILSLILGTICLRQFGKGLDKYISKKNLHEEQEKRSGEPIDLGDE